MNRSSRSNAALRSSLRSTTTADRVIDGDLAALGDASRQHLPAMATSLASTAVHAPRTPHASAYRDDLPGVEARRDTLADARRRELALMPLTLSQIYARRVGRAAAGAAAILCALGLLVILDDRFLVRLTAYFIPGFAIGVYALISIAFVLMTYQVAHWIAEQKFTARMRELVSKGDDAYRDLDQLAIGPFAVAAEKVRRVDQVSFVLPLVGIAVLAPLLAFVGYVGALAVQLNFGRGSIETFLRFTSQMGPVLVALTAGAVLVGLVAHAIRREEPADMPAGWVRWLGHWGVLVVSFVLAMVVTGGAMLSSFRMQASYVTPPEAARYLLALGGEGVILLPSIWFFLWWRRRERWRLGD